MEKNERRIKTGCSRILWAVLLVLLCVPLVVWSYTDFIDGTHTINNTIDGTVYIYHSASVTLEADAHIADIPPDGENGDMYVAGIVNFRTGVVDGFISVSPGAIITVYGTGFEDSSGPISTTQWIPAAPGFSDTLTGTYENGTPISLLFNSGTPIILVDTGGGEEPLTVEIDIKPGSYPNTINLGSNGVIPVAILSGPDFDATTVDPESVSLAGAEVAVRGKAEKLMARLEDVDGDGDLDLLVQVETQSDGVLWESGTVTLTGKTYDGQDIEGTDEVIIVPPDG